MAGGAGSFCITSDHILPFEDTQQAFLTDFSTEKLKQILAAMANAAMITHGDNFDFIGVWFNFDPHHIIGTALYFAIENDVTGIGIYDVVGTETFNERATLGIGGDNVEGMVIMWNVNEAVWVTGTGPDADFTRLALAHEYEHRFGIDLPPLLDGTPIQGDGTCGPSGHWTGQLDAQASCMRMSEWVGSNPATLAASGVNFNGDTGGATVTPTST